jgi:hypothetical protein
MTELILANRQAFSVDAIRCVLEQAYPETQEVWDEALTLMTGLSGVDLTESSDAILMGDYKEITVALGAKENLEAQLTAMFPSEASRSMMLSQGAPLILAVA